ncbi:MAG TPA: glycosyltransferase family 9 protein [Vicinamibacterales bacterium]|nr:glycosyltransferase family 9 protein [Vicinamibacterales bacterium]
MRTQTIRFLDYWLGVPACGVLTVARRLGGRTAPTPPQRILFLKFIEQGATVLAQDAIARAAARVGRDNLFFCVFESNRAILDLLDVIPTGNILTIRDSRLTTFALDFLRALIVMRRRRVDTVLDLEFFSRASAIFAFLSGARSRVGLHRFTGELPYRGDLMTHRVQYLPHVHISQQYAILVESAFADRLDEPLLKVPLARIAPPTGASHRFTPTAAERQSIETRLGIAGASRPSPIILLNPNASDLLPLRKWETSRFVELAKRLLQAFPQARIGVTGAPSEQAAAEQVCRDIGSDRVVSLAGKTTLRELLTSYTLADVLVTNDSGPAHFASLTPVSTVVLFGPETPRLFGSLAPGTTIIWKELACSPCVSVFNHRLSPCRNNVCMQTITVDEVLGAVSAAVAARGGSLETQTARRL